MIIDSTRLLSQVKQASDLASPAALQATGACCKVFMEDETPPAAACGPPGTPVKRGVSPSAEGTPSKALRLGKDVAAVPLAFSDGGDMLPTSLDAAVPPYAGSGEDEHVAIFTGCQGPKDELQLQGDGSTSSEQEARQQAQRSSSPPLSPEQEQPFLIQPTGQQVEAAQTLLIGPDAMPWDLFSRKLQQLMSLMGYDVTIQHALAHAPDLPDAYPAGRHPSRGCSSSTERTTATPAAAAAHLPPEAITYTVTMAGPNANGGAANAGADQQSPHLAPLVHYQELWLDMDGDGEPDEGAWQLEPCWPWANPLYLPAGTQHQLVVKLRGRSITSKDQDTALALIASYCLSCAWPYWEQRRLLASQDPDANPALPTRSCHLALLGLLTSFPPRQLRRQGLVWFSGERGRDLREYLPQPAQLGVTAAQQPPSQGGRGKKRGKKKKKKKPARAPEATAPAAAAATAAAPAAPAAAAAAAPAAPAAAAAAAPAAPAAAAAAAPAAPAIAAAAGARPSSGKEEAATALPQPTPAPAKAPNAASCSKPTCSSSTAAAAAGGGGSLSLAPDQRRPVPSKEWLLAALRDSGLLEGDSIPLDYIHGIKVVLRSGEVCEEVPLLMLDKANFKRVLCVLPAPSGLCGQQLWAAAQGSAVLEWGSELVPCFNFHDQQRLYPVGRNVTAGDARLLALAAALLHVKDCAWVSLGDKQLQRLMDSMGVAEGGQAGGGLPPGDKKGTMPAPEATLG